MHNFNNLFSFIDMITGGKKLRTVNPLLRAVSEIGTMGLPFIVLAPNTVK
jgi:hypothetical protein